MSTPYFAAVRAIGRPVTSRITETARIAAVALTTPWASVIAPPMASSARNEIAPMAVWATRGADHLRALLAVKRSA